MEYTQLVDIYQELESTTKRLEKTFIISKFLKNIKEDEIEQTILLLQGKVFPNWDDRKIGVASRMVLKAINKATGINLDKIEKEWAKIGDLGKVAQELTKTKKQSTLFSEKLTVKKVFQNLQKLPTLEGQGAVNKKVGLIAELLTSAKPLEARYIVRTVLEELRVGTAAGTLRDAIIFAFFLKDSKLNKEKNIIDFEESKDREKYNEITAKVQEAYDMSNDFSLVAKQSKKNKLDEIGLKVGIPIKCMLGPKEADAKAALERVGTPAQAEFKLDGFRCVGGYTSLYVKNKGFLCIRDIKIGDYILTHKGNFKKILAINKRKINKKERLFQVTTFYGNSFKISEKHPVLVFKENIPKWINIEKLKSRVKLIFPIPKIKSELPFKNKLNLIDESGYSKKIEINDFFFRFLGFWIGDGYTNEYHNTERVGLVFNAKKEQNLADDYEKNIKKFFQIKNISRSTYKGALCLYWRDKPLRIWLSTNFRREWKGKMLPYWFYGINKEQFNHFLNGWIESDGHIDKIGRTSITTKERDLAMFGCFLGLKFKRMMGLKRIRINDKNYYKLILPKSKVGYSFRKKDVLIELYSIKELKNRDPRTTLYNLQVEDDESYCSSMLSLHNCQIHKNNEKIMIFTRNLENVTNQFPEIIEYLKKHIKGESFILDAEAVGFNPKTDKYLPFQSISQRIKRKYNINEMSKEFPVELNIFDCMFYNGKNMINKPFEKRRKLLESIIIPVKRKIVLAKGKIVKNEDDVNKFFKESKDAGNEGLMLKKLDAPYKPGGRVGHMVKLKETEEPLDLVITEAEWGEGKRAKWFSSFTLACLDENGDFVTIGKVGTGIKEKDETSEEEESPVTFEQLTKLLTPLVISQKGKGVKVKPKILVEVAYEEIQKSPTYTSGYALRFPRVLRLRHMERSAEDAATLEYIEDYFFKQKK